MRHFRINRPSFSHPFAPVGPWAHGHGTSSRFYHSAAIEAMGVLFEEYQTRVDAGVEGANSVLEDFIAERKVEVRLIREHAEVCRKWARRAPAQKRAEAARLREARKQAYVEPSLITARSQAHSPLCSIHDRLAALGHDVQDIQGIWDDDKIYKSTAQVTDKSTCTYRCPAYQLTP